MKKSSLLHHFKKVINRNRFVSIPKAGAGFTLIELMVAIAITGILSVFLYNLYIFQSTTYTVQEQVSDMQQNARMAMEMISRDVRMAGFNPAKVTFAGLACGTSQIQIQADLNGDGDVTDDNEDITYALDTSNSENPKIKRKLSASASYQDFAENIQTFSITPILENSITVGATISIIARTRGKDPNHSGDGYHRITIGSDIMARNLF